ncbi:MAG TPA: FAD-dependent oxidoreductase [Pyrinomonadaceae bacterium]|jgi:2-polyprenyl-6-methoxyphenol hydroxylase-like FAD-dependent oxidoreductase|nr:FAD-dependent oxidoreductase [Pyrinomonadaceae bacterium]
MDGATKITKRCCIAGGGPAGMMLGFLLARAGVEVVVLEKHADFLRDFRGDTVHPSTLEVMHELGLLEAFLKLPHDEVRQLGGQIGDDFLQLADFSHLPTKCKFIALVPQWDFLDFLADQARYYPTFRLITQAEVQDVIEETGRIVGVKARTPDGVLDVLADLTIGADGRGSVVRDKAGLETQKFGAPMDVLWFRLRRKPSDGEQTLGRIMGGKMMVMLNRGDCWQCGYLIRKGEFENIKARGLEQFHNDIVSVAPFVADRTNELADWDPIKLLTVRIDRLVKWYRPGLLCIGDAAHAMSPIGGVGINLAIQDAVAAANILAERLSRNTVSLADLERVQLRRDLPTRMTQRLQIILQNNVIHRVLGNPDFRLPSVMKLINRWPFLRRIPARIVGIGFRAEHVKTTNMYDPKRTSRANRIHFSDLFPFELLFWFLPWR